ncbi:MAG: hypothetical protein WC890_00005 [Candidatus Margulisiibacteriota bacterium]
MQSYKLNIATVTLGSFPGWATVKSLAKNGHRVQLGSQTVLIQPGCVPPTATINATKAIITQGGNVWQVPLEGIRQLDRKALDSLKIGSFDPQAEYEVSVNTTKGQYPGVSDVPEGYGIFLSVVLGAMESCPELVTASLVNIPLTGFAEKGIDFWKMATAMQHFLVPEADKTTMGFSGIIKYFTGLREKNDLLDQIGSALAQAEEAGWDIPAIDYTAPLLYSPTIEIEPAIILKPRATSSNWKMTALALAHSGK